MDPVQGAAPREGQQRAAAGQLIKSLSSTGCVTPRLEGLEASWRSIHALGGGGGCTEGRRKDGGADLPAACSPEDVKGSMRCARSPAGLICQPSRQLCVARRFQLSAMRPSSGGGRARRAAALAQQRSRTDWTGEVVPTCGLESAGQRQWSQKGNAARAPPPRLPASSGRACGHEVIPRRVRATRRSPAPACCPGGTRSGATTRPRRVSPCLLCLSPTRRLLSPLRRRPSSARWVVRRPSHHPDLTPKPKPTPLPPRRFANNPPRAQLIFFFAALKHLPKRGRYAHVPTQEPPLDHASPSSDGP